MLLRKRAQRLLLMSGLVLALLAVSSAALAAGGLSGTYKTRVTGKTGPLAAFNGRWAVTFKTGKYTFKHNGAFAVRGKDKISGSTITVNDTSAARNTPYRCPSPGKYRFKLTGKK